MAKVPTTATHANYSRHSLKKDFVYIAVLKYRNGPKTKTSLKLVGTLQKSYKNIPYVSLFYESITRN